MRKIAKKPIFSISRKTSDEWGWNEENWSESKPSSEKSMSKKSTKKATTANNDDLLIDFGSDKAGKAAAANSAKKGQDDSWASWENDAWESLNK